MRFTADLDKETRKLLKKGKLEWVPSSGSDGAVRGLVRDKATKRLYSSAEFRPLDRTTGEKVAGAAVATAAVAVIGGAVSWFVGRRKLKRVNKRLEEAHAELDKLRVELEEASGARKVELEHEVAGATGRVISLEKKRDELKGGFRLRDTG